MGIDFLKNRGVRGKKRKEDNINKDATGKKKSDFEA